MAKARLDVGELFARLVKSVMVVLLVPAVIGLVQATLHHLDTIPLQHRTASTWIQWGFVAYTTVHLLLYRPRTVFLASHRLFSMVATGLFGGHVTSVEQGSSATTRPSRRRRTRSNGDEVSSGAAGSPLLVFSPYVIPFYTLLVCGLAALLRPWVPAMYLEIPAVFLVGVTLAFQWIMTADDLQEQREQWYMETYLLAIILVFLFTLILACVTLPWVLPSFSFSAAMADGVARAHAVYDGIWRQLFVV